MPDTTTSAAIDAEDLRSRYEAHRGELSDVEGHRVVCCDGCELADELPGLLDLNETVHEQNGYFRNERDLLAARAREIRDLHRATSARGLSVETCVDCGQRYPCPTVQLLDRALGFVRGDCPSGVGDTLMTDTTATAALDVLEAAIAAAARARYVARWPNADEQRIARYVTDMAADSTYRVEILAGFAEVFAAGRMQAAAEIRARLAQDIAEGDDVSNGQAIAEQHGWHEGLKLAADIAEEGLTS